MNSSAPYGDQHNFQKRVTKVIDQDKVYFKKPRSVHWEHLFFGQKSPLKPFFDETTSRNKLLISDFIFNLAIQKTSHYSGSSKEVPTTGGSLHTDHHFNFGVLLAYSYLFGISDLHRENLILTDRGIQVVDVESVLNIMPSISDSLLLPSHFCSTEDAGINVLLGNHFHFSRQSTEAILEAYQLTSNCFLKHSSDITQILNESISSSDYSRVILRRTRLYKDFLYSKRSKIELLQSEVEQLERGDIPYFYKFLKSSDIYYLASNQKEKSIVNLPKQFQQKLKTQFIAPKFLIPSKQKLSIKIQSGLYQLKNTLTAYT